MWGGGRHITLPSMMRGDGWAKEFGWACGGHEAKEGKAPPELPCAWHILSRPHCILTVRKPCRRSSPGVCAQSRRRLLRAQCMGAQSEWGAWPQEVRTPRHPRFLAVRGRY